MADFVDTVLILSMRSSIVARTFSILTVNLAIFQVDPKPAAPINKVRWYEFNYCVKCLYRKTTIQKLFCI